MTTQKNSEQFGQKNGTPERGEIVSRSEAKARGLSYYFTGNPCPKGHVSLRRVKKHDCYQCRKEPRPGDLARKREWRYGVAPGEVDAQRQAQSGRCAICSAVLRRAGGRRGEAVDHCHETGVVRGLLCGGCNRGLGHFGDDPEVLRRAAQYAEQGGVWRDLWGQVPRGAVADA